MPAGPVVANNTPLVALWALGRLDLLRDLFGEVFIPAAVQAEFLAIEETRRKNALANAPWIRATDLLDPRRASAYAGLDRGEAEVLALAEEKRASLVIIDERKGRRYAERLGFAFTGTLGVLLLAKEANLLLSVEEVLEKLERAGLHLSRSLVDRVLEMAGER